MSTLKHVPACDHCANKPAAADIGELTYNVMYEVEECGHRWNIEFSSMVLPFYDFSFGGGDFDKNYAAYKEKLKVKSNYIFFWKAEKEYNAMLDAMKQLTI